MGAVLAILVLENGMFGIPQSLASQWALLASLNQLVPARVTVGVALSLFLGVAVIGPATLRSWHRAIADWYHRDQREIARLDEENGRLRQDKRDLEARVKVLESAPRTDAEELKHDSRQLAAELRAFAEEWTKEREALAWKVENAETEEEREHAHQVLHNAGSELAMKLEEGYALVYRSRAMVLFGKAMDRGWIDAGEMIFAQHAVMPRQPPAAGALTMGIEGVASTLDQIANRL